MMFILDDTNIALKIHAFALNKWHLHVIALNRITPICWVKIGSTEREIIESFRNQWPCRTREMTGD